MRPGALKPAEVKLMREGSASDSAFEVADAPPAGEPWRWSFDPPRPARGWGELGELSAEQQRAADEFERAVAADGAAGPEHAHLRLRWLRARQFRPAAALEAWCKEVRAGPPSRR